MLRCGHKASGTVKKVIEINKYLLGTMAGGAADCQYWSVPGLMFCTAKVFSLIVVSFLFCFYV
jgi:hypothetical protein